MYAIVKDAAITATGTIKQLFPNTSFAGGVANSEFKKAENVEDVVNAEQKNRTYYYDLQIGWSSENTSVTLPYHLQQLHTEPQL